MRAIIFVIVFLLISYYSQAQKVKFGLQVSPLISWMKPDAGQASSNGGQFGFHWGPTFEYLITDNYAFALDIIIANGTGGTIKYSDSLRTFATETFVDPEVSYSIQYVGFPFSLKLMTNEIGYITYFGQFGISPAINLKSSGEISDDSVNQLVTKHNFKDEVTDIHLALLVGLGIEYSLGGHTSLTTGIFFSNGFTDMTKQDPSVIVNNISLKLGVIF